jgi:DNA-binding SARP family transcriptional activator
MTVSATAVFDTWLYVEQEGLRRLFRQATVAVARRALSAGDAARVVEPLAQLVTVDPYYEEGHSLLIEANETLGRRQAAAAAYQRYQRILRQELQIEPPVSLTRRYEPEAPGRTPPEDSLVSLRELTLHIVYWPGGRAGDSGDPWIRHECLHLHSAGGTAVAGRPVCGRGSPWTRV